MRVCPTSPERAASLPFRRTSKVRFSFRHSWKSVVVDTWKPQVCPLGETYPEDPCYSIRLGWKLSAWTL